MATAKILHMKENFWDAAKVILIWKYLASTAYIRKGKKKLRTSELSIYLKKAGGRKARRRPHSRAHTAEAREAACISPGLLEAARGEGAEAPGTRTLAAQGLRRERDMTGVHDGWTSGINI